MTNKDWWFLLVCTAIIAIVCTWGICSDTYYKRGVRNARLYYETMQTFPRTDWVNAHSLEKFKYPEQILETLEVFTLVPGNRPEPKSSAIIELIDTYELETKGFIQTEPVEDWETKYNNLWQSYKHTIWHYDAQAENLRTERDNLFDRLYGSVNNTVEVTITDNVSLFWLAPEVKE